MNTIQHEPLFTDLTSEEAAIIGGGVQYCPYTTRGVTSALNIRSGPGKKYDDVGNWNPGEVKLVESPPIVKNGFRKISSSPNRWVSTQYIQRTSGACAS
jgi:uncharacterized protein YraI